MAPASPSPAVSPLAHRGASGRWALLLIAWVIALFGWTVTFGFSNDDYIWIEGARWLPGRPWLQAALVPKVWSDLFVRPLAQLSFFLNYLCCGMHPFGYHLFNVALHALNVVLVWRIATALLRDGQAGLYAASLFAVVPAHPDAVTWVSGRTELIGAAWYFAAVLLVIRERPWSAAVCFAAALLSKESTISFPLVALAVMVARGRTRWPALLLYGALVSAYLLLRWEITAHFAAGEVGLMWLEQGQFGALAAGLLHQFAAAVCELAANRPLPNPLALTIAVLGAVAVAWLVRLPEQRRIAMLASAWFLASLAPFLGFFVFQPRYVYLSSVALALLLALIGQTLWARGTAARRTVAVAGALLIATWASIVCARNAALRRNALLTDRVVQEIARAVPHPLSGSYIEVSGLDALADKQAVGTTPVLLFGLAQALQLHYGDTSLAAVRSEQPRWIKPGPQTRVIRLQWDQQRQTFVKLPGVQP